MQTIKEEREKQIAATSNASPSENVRVYQCMNDERPRITIVKNAMLKHKCHIVMRVRFNKIPSLARAT
jgi:hypothetical protein